nr:acidic mammalian chitinase-like [Onthophagus taurus]
MFKITVYLLLFITFSQATDKIVCYFSNWAETRPQIGRFDVEDIDPYLCTHLIYAFIGLNEDSTINILDYQNSIGNNAIKRFNNLRLINPELKTLIAIGGWTEGSERYSDMVSTLTTRSIFINSTVEFMETYGFDGFDLDWEYPNKRGGKPGDKENFIQLLAEMRPVFDERGWLLTAAVNAAYKSVNICYDVVGLNRYLDFINLMTYNLHGSWDNVTGHNTPLHPAENDWDMLLNVDSCVIDWIKRGASPEKLILGTGTYGKSFTLTNEKENSVNSPTLGTGELGPYTGEFGILGYYEICENILNGWTRSWDDTQLVPYAFNGNQWVGYDDVKSLQLKAEYAISKGLGGIMVWSVDTDDFNGICGEKNPLINQIKKTLNGI